MPIPPDRIPCSKLYRILRLGGGVPGAWGGGIFSLEKSKISHFFKLENFQKMLKNQWKFYNFLKIFKEILWFVENFIEIFAKIQGKI